MSDQSEIIKQRIGNPYDVIQSIERAAAEGIEVLSDDHFFAAAWLGLYQQRNEEKVFMLRARMPGGVIGSDQLEVIAEIIDDSGKHFMDLTTRQEIQLYNLDYKKIPHILQKLNEVGISTQSGGDTLRNIISCPLSGVNKEELIDTTALVQEVDTFFSGNPDFVNLPFKLNIGITGCISGCIHPEIQCISLVAIAKDPEGEAQVGFDVLVGGVLSTKSIMSQSLGVFIKPEEVLEVIKVLVTIWRDQADYRLDRDRAQFAFLVQDWGVERLRQAVEEKLGKSLEKASERVAGNRTIQDHVGVRSQKVSGSYAVGVPILAGRITLQQIKKIIDLARRYTDDQSFRLSNRQNINILNVREIQVDKLLNGLNDVELSMNVHPIRRGLITCTGTEFCKRALTETKARSRAIVEYLEKRVALDEPISLHISGCAGDCAQYQIAHIGLSGTKATVDERLVDAYDIYLGARQGSDATFNHLVMREVPATECAKRIEQLFVGYKKKRKENENFNDWCARVGDERVVDFMTEGTRHLIAEAHETVNEKENEALYANSTQQTADRNEN